MTESEMRIFNAIGQLEAKMDSRFNNLDARFNNLDTRITNIEHRLASIEDKLIRINNNIPIPIEMDHQPRQAKKKPQTV